MAAPTTVSRFALLAIESSDEEEDAKKPLHKNRDNSKSAQKKRKARKKQNDDTANLRSMAFGSNNPSSNRPSTQRTLASTASQNQYEAWAEHDQGHVDELFQEQLQQAILLSKVESEKKAEMLKPINDQPDTTQNSTKSKNKKKSKQKPMSIEEFQQGPAKPKVKEAVVSSNKTSGGGDDFFEDVKSNAANIVRQDKLQEEYSKQFKVQAVLQAKYNTELESRDKIIEELRKELQDTQEELKSVKKRNKQLCFILGQSEMKEKAEIVQQVDSLTQIKDELTLQVTEITSELEKEKSKVHSLQNDLVKAKRSK